MGRKFEDVQMGDQLELPAGAGSIIYCDNRNPDRVVQVAIVTDIWFDPVDGKEYVGLAKLRNDGSYGKPTEKRTITGLARAGWRFAKKDWIDYLKKLKAADRNKVVRFGRKETQ